MLDDSMPQKEASAVVEQFYSCLQFEPGGSPNFDHILRLFHAEARITPPISDTEGCLKPMSPVQFAAKYSQVFGKLRGSGAKEYELAASVSCFKSTCQIMSKYEFATDDGTIARQGMNSFQLVKDAQRWWIVSLTWDRY